MVKQKKIKVLLAQFPLETHNRGVIAVAGMLRDSGMEVILLGNAVPEHIIRTAVQEYVDVVGISTYCGGEIALGSDLLKEAEKAGVKDRTAFLIGGIFPPKDIPEKVVQRRILLLSQTAGRWNPPAGHQPDRQPAGNAACSQRPVRRAKGSLDPAPPRVSLGDLLQLVQVPAPEPDLLLRPAERERRLAPPDVPQVL